MNDAVQPASILPSQEDFDAIMRTSMDYVDGWYNADAERMRRALHPDLVKRTLVQNPDTREWQLWRPTTAEMMVEYTRKGGGSKVPEPERQYQVTITNVFRHIATVQCVSPDFMDYLHLAKFEGQGWLIVNVLWEVREGELSP
jgi:hypothetical protein